jgi:hypothetical protein
MEECQVIDNGQRCESQATWNCLREHLEEKARINVCSTHKMVLQGPGSSVVLSDCRSLLERDATPEPVTPGTSSLR